MLVSPHVLATNRAFNICNSNCEANLGLKRQIDALGALWADNVVGLGGLFEDTGRVRDGWHKLVRNAPRIHVIEGIRWCIRPLGCLRFS